MPGPKPYSDIGGGGPNPPHGEDFFDRIVNVHWPQRAVFTGGVFIAADDNSHVFYLKIGLGAPTDSATGDPIWQDLGTLDFASPETGWIKGSAYGQVGRDKEPVFVLVGGGGNVDATGVIMASQDGLNWSKVYTFSNTTASGRGAVIFGVVWDGNEFWAAGHTFDQFGPPEFRATETDLLFNSQDGFNWGEVGRHVTTYIGSIPGETWPEYNTGLLVAHCNAAVTDQYNNGVPSGIYAQTDKMRITPSKPPSIRYLDGVITYGPSSSDLIVTNFDTRTVMSSDPGMPAVYGVAEAGGAWVATGGQFEGIYAPAAAILIPSSITETGFAWKALTPPGADSPIITVCGGEPKSPPP